MRCIEDHFIHITVKEEDLKLRFSSAKDLKLFINNLAEIASALKAALREEGSRGKKG